jgi:hypothetical protein
MGDNINIMNRAHKVSNVDKSESVNSKPELRIVPKEETWVSFSDLARKLKTSRVNLIRLMYERKIPPLLSPALNDFMVEESMIPDVQARLKEIEDLEREVA